MKAPHQTRHKSKSWLRSVPLASGAATIFIAILALAALLIGLGDRAAALPVGLSANPGAVVELFLCGGALLLLHSRTIDRRKQFLGRALAATAGVLALANVLSMVISGSGLWMLPMSPGAAANFLFAAIALLLLDVEWRRQQPAQLFGCVVGVIALLALLEHFFGATVTSDRPGILRDAMSVPGALGCIFLAAGILCKYPDRGVMRVVTSDAAHGVMARRLLMAAVAIPATLAWLALWGERAGFFDGSLGAAMLVASNIVLFLLVIWKNAEALQQSDLSRLEAEAALRLSRDDLERQIIKRTEQLRKSEELQRTALNALPQHLAVIDKDGIILETNQAWHRYVRDEAPAGAANARIGSRYVDTFSEFAGRGSEAARETTDGIAALLAGEIESFSLEYATDSPGGQLWFLLTALPLGREGGGAIVAHTDITVRRKSDERAHIMAEMLRSLQAVTDSALSQLSFDSLIPEILMRVSEAVHADSASLLLMSEDHRFLSLRASIGAGEDDDRDIQVPVGEGVAGHIAATQQPMLVDDLKSTVVISPGLRSGFASLIGVPLIGADRMIGVIHAQSRRPTHFSKEDLRLMQLAAERIAVAIDRAQRYEAEQQSRIRAEEASRMKDEFLAVVSHELRSPLNTILGWVTLLRGGNLRKEAAERALETIERSARAQNRIVSDLLDVSKIITGKLSINVRPVELAGIIEAAVESVRPAAEAKSIRLQLALDLSAGPVSVDPDRIQQVVWNLLSNAIRFTPAGGRIQVRLERVSTHIEITVKDDGCGINPEFLPFVFDRFSQADSSSTRKMLGLGLGLAIVRHLVELHGGVVNAESDGEGLGSTFVIELPLVLMRQTGNLDGRGRVSDSLDGLPSPPPIDGLKVLIVDENADARELVSEILVNCEADVSTASSAEEALAMLADSGWQPEVIIADIEVPESEGYNLIRELRARESYGALRQIPAIALTAFARSEDRMRALGAGYQMHLSKPVEPAELVTVVASLAGRIGG